MYKCDHPYEDCREDNCYCGCRWCTPPGDSKREEE